MREPKTRAEKIKFLKAIQRGAISIKDFQQQAEVWLYNSQRDYFNTNIGLWVTEEEFKAQGHGGIILPHNNRDYEQRG